MQINTTCGIGSTGKICVDISKMLTENGVENYILYSNKSNGYELGIACSSKKYTKVQALKSRVFGNYGFNSNLETRRMIKHLKQIKPDIVHLHNIHGHDCNLEMLFNYFRDNKIKLVWTFHDCWAFTGYCPHFTMAGCDKWKRVCEKCCQYKEYSFGLDKSKILYRRKKELFSGLDLTIVTPSRWLAQIVKQSFLKEYPVVVINNGIDLKIFNPTSSDFREKYNIPFEKKILLGVAFDWGIRKGLDVFIELAKRLNGEKYQIVLVGTNSSIDERLPANIISIHRTHNQKELAEIYTSADWFINPTREENFPTVNLESMACGTPVITFDTGGSPESLTEKTGIVVPDKNWLALYEIIENFGEGQEYEENECVLNAQRFEKNNKYQEYLKVYDLY